MNNTTLKPGDSVRVLRHRNYHGEYANYILEGTIVTLKDIVPSVSNEFFTSFETDTGWIVRSDDIERVSVVTRQVCRVEIVSGVYGRVEVNTKFEDAAPGHPGTVAVRMVDRNGNTLKIADGYSHMTAEELRELANVATQLADALKANND